MKADVLGDLAVIIPVGPKESAWRALLPDLSQLPASAEIILVGLEPKPTDLETLTRDFKGGPTIQWITAPPGRARQLNTGARATKKSFLWFLHADTRLLGQAIPALTQAVHDHEDALYYFDLTFMSDGPHLMRLNTLGVWIRSHWMGLPFGDQGFCLKRDLFKRLGAFDETAPYGEDHLLVWAAHHNAIPLRPIGTSIQTSARRYRENGWGKSTSKTMFLTAKQALPELVRLIKKRATHD